MLHWLKVLYDRIFEDLFIFDSFKANTKYELLRDEKKINSAQWYQGMESPISDVNPSLYTYFAASMYSHICILTHGKNGEIPIGRVLL